MVASTATTAIAAREAHEAALALTHLARQRPMDVVEPTVEPPADQGHLWDFATIHIGAGGDAGEMTVHDGELTPANAHVGLGRGAWLSCRTPSILVELADALDPDAWGETSAGPWRVRDTVAGRGDRVIEAGRFYLCIDDHARRPVTDALRDAATQLRDVQEGENR